MSDHVPPPPQSENSDILYMLKVQGFEQLKHTVTTFSFHSAVTAVDTAVQPSQRPPRVRSHGHAVSRFLLVWPLQFAGGEPGAHGVDKPACRPMSPLALSGCPCALLRAACGGGWGAPPRAPFPGAQTSRPLLPPRHHGLESQPWKMRPDLSDPIGNQHDFLRMSCARACAVSSSPLSPASDGVHTQRHSYVLS